MPGPKFTAIVPAAGFSSRMGVYKPLLPLGEKLVIEKTIGCFKSSGINDIIVVVGFKRDLLSRVVDRLGVRTVFNSRFEDGMYSSICTGVNELDDSAEAFFLLPADCAFVSPETVSALISAYRSNPVSVIYPTYKGRRGHPVLISCKLKEVILNSNPEGGLRTLLEDKAQDFLEIPVDDIGISIDMDTVHDYQSVADNLARFPSEHECLKFLDDANMGDRVIAHSKEVSHVAVRIAEHMNSNGRLLNLGLVMAAGLLHDIARDRPDHAKAGAEIISGLGYPDVAEAAITHMNIGNDQVEALGEAAILYLADKMVKEDRIMPLDKRLSESLLKFKDNPDAEKNVRVRFENAFRIKAGVEEIIGKTIENILAE